MFRKKKKKEKEKKGARGRVLTVKNKVNESNDQDDEDLHLMLKATRVPYKYPTLSLHSLTPLWTKKKKTQKSKLPERDSAAIALRESRCKMANANTNNTEAEHVSIDSEAAHVISAVEECHDDDDVGALHDVVQGLPSHAVKDLLSVGVRVLSSNLGFLNYAQTLSKFSFSSKYRIRVVIWQWNIENVAYCLSNFIFLSISCCLSSNLIIFSLFFFFFLQWYIILFSFHVVFQGLMSFYTL